jgi:hypothetical protein
MNLYNPMNAVRFDQPIIVPDTRRDNYRMNNISA